MAQNWTLREDSVYYLPGVVRSNKIAAFDFGNTLIWSDSGNDMTRVDDWVPTTSPNKLISALTDLIQNDWTIVIFSNHLGIQPTGLERILDFISKFQTELLQQFKLVLFEPFVYVATIEDQYYKPNRGMWDMFIEDTILLPSPASFYCGDEAGPQATTMLYRAGDHDRQFAEAIRLTYYTPDEILGVYEPPPINFMKLRYIIVMAANSRQWIPYFNWLGGFAISTIDNFDPGYATILHGRDGKVPGTLLPVDRFETLASRQEVAKQIPIQYHGQTVVLMFTRPIEPFIDPTDYNAYKQSIQDYAQALDVHPNFETEIPAGTNGEPFRIIRIN